MSGKSRSDAIRRELDRCFIDLVHTLLGAPNKAQSTRQQLRYGGKGSLCVDVARRIWYSHEEGVGGDALTLVRRCLGYDISGALAWAENWLGGAAQTPSVSRPTRPDAGRDKRQRRNAELAQAIWRQAQPVTPEKPAWRYLQARGLDLTDGVPATLRYHPALKHSPTGLLFPALVAAVTIWPGKVPVAVHRTFLKLDGSDKAAVSCPKMLLGPAKGAAVRLAPAADELIICEGIEDGLSVRQIKGGAAVWAGISTSGMTAVTLPDPPLAAHLIIAADADSAGQVAARKAAEKWKAEGRAVEIATPPDGHNDWNDVVRKEAACPTTA